MNPGHVHKMIAVDTYTVTLNEMELNALTMCEHADQVFLLMGPLYHRQHLCLSNLEGK